MHTAVCFPKLLGRKYLPGPHLHACSQELQLLAREWLKCWFYRDTRTGLCKDVCSDDPAVIVSHRGKPTTVAAERMFYTELAATGAVQR